MGKKVFLRFSEVEIKHEGEFGYKVSFNCPECGNEICYAENPWWDTRCKECGYKLAIELVAIGKK